MNDLVGYVIRTFIWPIIKAGTTLANSMGLYGYDWAVLMAGLLIFAAMGTIYFIYRFVNALLGRDPYVEYLKYKRKWEADSKEHGADQEIRYKPRRTIAAIIMGWVSPLLAAILILGHLLCVSRICLWTTTRTIFNFDVLNHTLLYLLDYAITSLIAIALLLAAIALLIFVLFYLARVILKGFTSTSKYAEFNRFLSRGRIRRGVGAAHGTKDL